MHQLRNAHMYRESADSHPKITILIFDHKNSDFRMWVKLSAFQQPPNTHAILKPYTYNIQIHKYVK